MGRSILGNPYNHPLQLTKRLIFLMFTLSLISAHLAEFLTRTSPAAIINNADRFLNIRRNYLIIDFRLFFLLSFFLFDRRTLSG